MSLRCVLASAPAASRSKSRGPGCPCSSFRTLESPAQRSRRCHQTMAGRRPSDAVSSGNAEEFLSPQEALLAALRESGTPLEQIQLGRAEDDDETFLDVLDAEQDEWMRSPPPPPEFMESLFASDAGAGEAEQPQQLQQGAAVKRQPPMQQQQPPPQQQTTE
ncbi:hypothetical protein ABPG77_010721 [Micractinium sp. CCAP 211/92]